MRFFHSRMLAAIAAGALLLGFGLSGQAQAAYVGYPTEGSENPFQYSFTATTTGLLSAYFLPDHGDLASTLGVLVNGKDQGAPGPDNQTAMSGQTVLSTQVAAGDLLTFYIAFRFNGDRKLYSDATLNPAGENHAYASLYTQDPGSSIPNGIYVGFEDLSPAQNGGFSDYNYKDYQFVATNVTLGALSPVPLPPALPMFGAALLGLGGLALRRKRAAGSAPPLAIACP